ncbi:MFS transporter [Actinoallomurus rhizosphaericola]|uniref:MFS transporter n=1 Tax=Actinoallomurus rhizosphaericola TaxID=2952536 RepID=UPI002092AE20|nr:MFS transporter [Actinoallomurus rhizosphaericola]MCO5995658.1 MFS transporter [Actinoallomurus rhizosphaericola]
MFKPPRSAGGTLAASCFAIMLAQIANVIPAPINGEIQTSLHATGVGLAWVTSAFLLPTAILELSFGVLGDLLGRRRVMLAGTALLAAGSLVAGSAHTVQLLWAGQAISGIGAGALIPTSLAIAVASARDDHERSRGVALWTLSMSIGTVLGVIISGAVSENASWHLSFYAIVPLAVLSLLATALLAAESRQPEGRSLDWAGQSTIAIGMFCLLYGIVQGAGSSWSTSVIILLAIGVAGLVAFVVIESRAPAPMLNLAVFRIPAFSAAALAAVIGMFSFLGSVYVLSIRIGALQHKTGIAAAAFFIVLQGVPCVLGPALPKAMRRFGARRLVTGGLVLLAMGEFWLAATPVATSSLGAHVGPLLLEGVGFLFVVSAMTSAAISAVPLSATGMASAAISTARDFGMCIGPTIVSAVALGAAGSDLPHRLAGLAPDTTAAAGHAAAAGGPFAVLSIPAAAPAALRALSHGYSLGLIICACAALAAALTTALWLRESTDRQAAPAPVTAPA